MLEQIKALLTPSVSTDTKLKGVSIFIGRVLGKMDTRLVSLESRQLQKGDKGDKGDTGKDGLNGKPGKDGKDGPKGKDGLNGKDGKEGADGNTGVSVVDSEVALDGHLVLTLSNGKIIDAGEIITEKVKDRVFVAGNAWQVIVSSVAPANPQINQLWYDIS